MIKDSMIIKELHDEETTSVVRILCGKKHDKRLYNNNNMMRELY